MTLLPIVMNVFAGLLLAAHYKTDKLITVLGTVLFAWPNAWGFLLLRKRGNSVLKSVLIIIGAYFALFCLAVAVAVLLAALEATSRGTVLG